MVMPEGSDVARHVSPPLNSASSELYSVEKALLIALN